jgi:DNA-binding response OmpR family regulator
VERLRELGCTFDRDRRLLGGPRGPVRLSASEARLLEVLYGAEGGPVGRRELQQACGLGTDRAVDFTVRRLRTKIERDPSDPRVVLTVHGHGYGLGLGGAAGVVPAPRERVTIGAVEADLPLGIVYRSGSERSLTTLQRQVLQVLTEAVGTPVTREALFRTVWGRTDRRGLRAVDAVVAQLRQAIEPRPDQPVHLITVRNVGYRLVREIAHTNVRPVSGASGASPSWPRSATRHAPDAPCC